MKLLQVLLLFQSLKTYLRLYITPVKFYWIYPFIEKKVIKSYLRDTFVFLVNHWQFNIHDVNSVLEQAADHTSDLKWYLKKKYYRLKLISCSKVNLPDLKTFYFVKSFKWHRDNYFHWWWIYKLSACKSMRTHKELFRARNRFVRQEACFHFFSSA